MSNDDLYPKYATRGPRLLLRRCRLTAEGEEESAETSPLRFDLTLESAAECASLEAGARAAWYVIAGEAIRVDVGDGSELSRTSFAKETAFSSHGLAEMYCESVDHCIPDSLEIVFDLPDPGIQVEGPSTAESGPACAR